MCINKHLLFLLTLTASCAVISCAFADGKNYRPDDKNDRDSHSRPQHSVKYHPNDSKSDSPKSWSTGHNNDKDMKSVDFKQNINIRSNDNKYKSEKTDHDGWYSSKKGDIYYKPNIEQSAKSYRPEGINYRPVENEPPVNYRPPKYKSGFYFYYNSNYARPYHYGYWSFAYETGGCRKSCYFYFGYMPYVQTTRIVVADYPAIVYVNDSSSGYYLENYGREQLDNTLADIRSAWIDARFDLLQQHVNIDDKIAVFLDGQYNYSITGQDYLDMTHDAFEKMTTVSFVWNDVKKRTDGCYTAIAKHQYRDSDGNVKSVYVSYGLRKIGSEYHIIEAGSSLSPI